MHYLLALLLALLSLLVISYPLLKARQREDEPQPPSNADNPLTRNIESAFDEIDQLQMEFELGVIEPDDYQRRMNELRRDAAESLRAYDQQSPTSPDDLDALIEERIRLRRLTLRNDNGESP